MSQAAEVARYLQENPGFFEDYADLIAEIFIPHPHGGRAVPIAERQILTLREKNRLLENKLTELLQFGEDNDAISEKLHKLTVGLLQTSDLAGMVGTVQYHLQESFRVPHVLMRLWPHGAQSNLREFDHVSESVRQLASNLATPYCGPYVTDEVLSWFGDVGPQLKSFAQLALQQPGYHDGQPFGIVVLASEDSERFYPEMGTLYLQRLAELIAAATLRCL